MVYVAQLPCGGRVHPQGNSCCRDECWVFGFSVRHFIIASALFPLSSPIGPSLAAQSAPLAQRVSAPAEQRADTKSQSASPAPPPAPVPQSVPPQQGPEVSHLAPPAILIPRLSRGPSLDDFVTMKPAGEVAPQMTKVTGFVQRDPHDGAPVSQRTEAYLGYDQRNLYAVFVCFDEPAKVRGRKSRREDISDEDPVEVMLDTFHDRRRAYAFQINPLGVQWDAIWSESPHEEVAGKFDTSWDTLWYSQGRLTEQ